MAPSKKTQDTNNNAATKTINPEEFSYTRNLIIVGLAELQTAVNAVQTAIQDLSKGYIERTYDMVGDHTTSDGQGPGRLFVERATTPAPDKAPENAKKRKRAPIDPHAPKRPVTAYFLYMKSHRPVIQQEMGPGHTAKEVADEGTRRWNAKSKDEQHIWRLRYWINRAAYKVKLQAYKEGKPIPEISEEEAKKLFEEQSKNGQLVEDVASDEEVPAVDEDAAVAKSSGEDSGSEEEAVPARAPSPPKPNKRQKTAKAATEKASVEKKGPKAKAPAAREPSSSPAPVSPVKTTTKEKKPKALRKSAARESEPVPEPKSTLALRKDKAPKKKRKSEAADA